MENDPETKALLRFASLLSTPIVNLIELRRLSWHGVPEIHRACVWKLLLGYTPQASSRSASVLERKRAEYANIVAQHYMPRASSPLPSASLQSSLNSSHGSNRGLDTAMLHQISIDIPRTDHALVKANPAVGQAMIRVLYCWAIRRPASGYVQGLNDLLSPFFEVFLHEHLLLNGQNISDGVLIEEKALRQVEADVFWCFSRLVDTIQDNYTPSQSGITRQIRRLRQICERIDEPLVCHLDAVGVPFVQFAFRWMNCLLLREFKIQCIIRMWDTYLAEGVETAFSRFHTFVCAAFLVRWSREVKERGDFGDVVLFLQKPPTLKWSLQDVEMLLSEAYLYQSLFEGKA